ncbi:transposase [bacterium]|nr:transposase [bacterium]
MKIYKNRLQHWIIEGACYMISFRLGFGSLNSVEIKLVLDHIKSGHKSFYNLYAVQIMPDHIHVILIPNNGYEISRIIKGIKIATAIKINVLRNRIGPLWEKDYFDRIIRSESDLEEKVNYIFENPLRAELTEDCENYQGWYLQKD